MTKIVVNCLALNYVQVLGSGLTHEFSQHPRELHALLVSISDKETGPLEFKVLSMVAQEVKWSGQN